MASKIDIGPKDQLHPQQDRDRNTLNRLLREEATDLNLAELARLRIRYNRFSQAAEIFKRI